MEWFIIIWWGNRSWVRISKRLTSSNSKLV
jgi:hypothetical protein